MPDPPGYNDRILVVGKTQSGKTHFTRRMFLAMTGARRFFIDPKGQGDVGVQATRSVAAIDWAADVVRYVPAQLDRGEYEELYDALARAGGPMVIWLDEAMGPTTGSWQPAGMRIIVTQGAALGVGHWACSQRPVDIAANLRTEAEHIFMFVPTPHPLNLDALAPDVGVPSRELAERFRALHEQEGEHSFLWYARSSHELLDCAPVPAAERAT